MKKLFETIKDSALFIGIKEDEFEKLTKCMDAKIESFQKNEIIFLSGDCISSIGVVLNGRIQIVQESSEGSQTVIANLSSPELFGEVFACIGVKEIPVTVLAIENCEIMFINYEKIITSCSSACSFHTRLIKNMLKLIAQKTLLLNQKIEILSKRSTRDRLILFFHIHNNGKREFSIPYNREQLAAFLCVERSALSGELCKMRDEGLIKFHKNKFEINI